MNNTLNTSFKNNYLTTKQWQEVIKYVKNKKNTLKDAVIEEVVEEKIIEEPEVKRYMTRSITQSQTITPSGNILTSSGGTLASGDYYLNADTTLSSRLNIASNSNVTIDLNGYVLKVSSGFVALVSTNSTLTIIDSNPNSTHYGTLNNGFWTYKPTATSGTIIKGGIITGGTGDRGGAFLVSGTLVLNSGTIAGCVAQETDPDQTTEIHQPTGGAGGAVYVQADGNSKYQGSFIMNGGFIKYCKADPDIQSLGGAVFIDSEGQYSGTFTMNGGTIENCSAYRGGAVYVHESIAEGASGVATFNMYNGSLQYNVAREHGGAVYCAGHFTMHNGTISNNISEETGSVVDGVAVNKGYGGGVHVQGTRALFVMNDGVISKNKAASGGGVMMYTDSTMTMNGGTICENIASGSGGAGNGGAIYLQASTLNFNKGTLENNWARRYGGAININQTASMYLNGECLVLNNSANHGGGISQEAGDCRIELSNKNIMISGNTARLNGNGGGMFIEKGTLNISAGTIQNNTAAGKGGGISMCVQRIGGDISVNMTGGNIINNSAGITGGGIDIFSDFTDSTNTINRVNVYLHGGIIENNTSNDNGGAVQVWVNEANSESVIYIGDQTKETYPSINDNRSNQNGGAISISSGDVFMRKGVLKGNSCVKNGGSVYVSGGNFTMKNGVFDDNTSEESGGAIYIIDGDVNIGSGTISNNIALSNGGAIAVANGNVVIGEESCYNAGGASTHAHPVIENNIASVGGGIYVNGGETVMWCGEIKDNRTYEETVNVLVNDGSFTYNGGVIGIPFDSGVAVLGGTFTDNTTDHNNVIQFELHYHSRLIPDFLNQELLYNHYIPKSKWIGSPKGDILHIDPDDNAPTWGDLFPKYEFIGWVSNDATNTKKVFNLYAQWADEFGDIITTGDL